MELKDMILSTLAELDESEKKTQTKMSFEVDTKKEKQKVSTKKHQDNTQETKVSDETEFLNGVRERVLVLFEGLQSPQNQNIDTKIDVTLNFLEFLLALIEDRLKAIDIKQK